MTGLFGDKDEKKELDIDNEEIMETAAILFKVRAKVISESLQDATPTVFIEEYMKMYRALKSALKKEADEK